MNRSTEATGKTIEDAINQALEELKVDRDQASVEVLDKPKSGFLGFGGIPARVKVTCLNLTPAEKAKDFIKGLLEKMKSDADAEIEKEDENGIRIRLTGNDLGILIGHRGETLDAIQHITGFVVNRNEEKHVRIIVDTENYREKREESLERLAMKMAAKAVKYKRNMSLEPMNAYERHVIHTALQNWRDVSTYSTGTEPNRKVVVSYNPGKRNEKQEGQPARQRRSGKVNGEEEIVYKNNSN